MPRYLANSRGFSSMNPSILTLALIPKYPNGRFMKSINAYNNCISEIKIFELDSISHLINKSESGISKLNDCPKNEGLSSTFSLKKVFDASS